MDDSIMDDDFFMYAALRSGPNTLVVTNDHLNHQHVFLGQLANLFVRWLLNKRVLVERQSLNLTFPPKFDVCVTRFLKSNGSSSRWFVPVYRGLTLSNINYNNVKYFLLYKNI